jgi:tRNA threonylcarbamoyladenosine biosynthesis protein TsaB
VLVLALDTSTSTVSVAVGDDGVVVGEVRLVGERRHAERLAPAVAYLFGELGVEPRHLSAVAVGLGPGLFTGLRVGVTTAKAMATALRLPVVGIPSLDLVAYPLRHTSRLVVAVLDARRREVFHARYRTVPGGVQRVSEYEVASPVELAADLEALDEAVLLAGDGVGRYRQELATVSHAELAGAGFGAPSATALVELAAARMEREEFEPASAVRPLYLRRSDAEIEWDERHR